MPLLPVIGTVCAICGLFLGLWYRTVAGMAQRRQPGFLRQPIGKWGIPAAALILLVTGASLLYTAQVVILNATIIVCCLIALAILSFDRYSAEARVLYDTYNRIQAANPGMEELEVLFRMAERRYPDWPQDRLLELVAGKSVEDVILIILIQENEIHPISDWGLYRKVKHRVSRVVGRGKGDQTMRKSLQVGLLVVFAAIGGWAQEKASEPAKQGIEQEVPRFSEVTPRIGVAGQPTEAGFRLLAEKGYKAVVNFRTATEPVDLPAEEKLVLSLGMKYIHVPVPGNDLQDSQMVEFLKVMDELKDEKVLLHCAGANRVSGFLMAYRALRDGLSVEEAEAEARKAGLRSDPLAAFARQAIEKRHNP